MTLNTPNNYIEPSYIQNLLRKYDYSVKKNDILGGYIVGIERKYTLCNLGLERISFLIKEDIDFISMNLISRTDNFFEFVILKDNLNKKSIVSILKLNHIRSFEQLKQLDLKNFIFYGMLKKKIRKGSLIDLNNLTIFISNYHLSKYYKRIKIFTDQSKILPLKILGIKIHQFSNQLDRNLIFASSRIACFQNFISFVKVDAVQIATVIEIKKYGIFFNIAGIRSLLHISQLPEQNRKNLYKEYKPGTQISIRILEVNTSEGKISLTNHFNEKN